MQDRLHEIIAQCAMIHETNIATDIINDLDAIEEKLSNINSDIKEHYLTLLLQYYFQQNNLDCAQQLLLQGYKFEMRFCDIKEAFTHIVDQEENVIEFFEDNVVMLKDVIQDEDLIGIYEYYIRHENYRPYLENALLLIKKNRYVCTHAYKCRLDCSEFFLDEALLESLMRDLPFLLK